MAQPDGEWLDGIAARAARDAFRIESALATHHIVPAPVLASPRRLMLVEIAFSGVKDGVVDDGPFEFRWGGLGHGLWAMLTDRNLRGKSSIMEVVRWLLRGRPSSNLQDDVRRWIHKARLRFLLDDVNHEVRIEAQDGVRGNLVRIKSEAEELTLANFASDGDFEAVMADFFMRALSMDTITSWRDSGDPDESGQAISHGWVAFSGAMFIGTNYEVLLGDMPVAAGLNARLIQMYLGVPWVSTLAAAKSAQQAVQNAADIRARRRAQGQTARRNRVDLISAELESRRRELSGLPSDQQLRDRLSSLSTAYADKKRQEQVEQHRIERETAALRQAEAAYQEDRRDLQTHLDSMAAGAVFRMLDPTCCPRCDHSIPDSRKKQEKTTHACAVCGESMSAGEDAETLRSELEIRVKASKAAHDKLVAGLEAATIRLAEEQNGLATLQNQIDESTARLGTFARRQELLTAISVLQGRLQEAGFEPGQEGEGNEDDLAVLNAVVAETEGHVKTLREDLLKDVSARLVEYAQSFGMHNLSQASLKGNANLSLVKGGVPTSYSKVTEGEKLRLKVATVLAMIEVAEKRGVGRHPGLLMIDSPAAQEVSAEDLDELVAGLQSVSKSIPHIQVFVAGRTSTAITEHVPEKNRREALNGGFLW